MIVTMTLKVDVDLEAWATIYGVEGARAVREDVRTYALGQLQDSAAAEEGGIRSVTLK